MTPDYSSRPLPESLFQIHIKKTAAPISDPATGKIVSKGTSRSRVDLVVQSAENKDKATTISIAAKESLLKSNPISNFWRRWRYVTVKEGGKQIDLNIRSLAFRLGVSVEEIKKAAAAEGELEKLIKSRLEVLSKNDQKARELVSPDFETSQSGSDDIAEQTEEYHEGVEETDDREEAEPPSEMKGGVSEVGSEVRSATEIVEDAVEDATVQTGAAKEFQADEGVREVLSEEDEELENETEQGHVIEETSHKNILESSEVQGGESEADVDAPERESLEFEPAETIEDESGDSQIENAQETEGPVETESDLREAVEEGGGEALVSEGSVEERPVDKEMESIKESGEEGGTASDVEEETEFSEFEEAVSHETEMPESEQPASEGVGFSPSAPQLNAEGEVGDGYAAPEPEEGFTGAGSASDEDELGIDELEEEGEGIEDAEDLEAEEAPLKTETETSDLPMNEEISNYKGDAFVRMRQIAAAKDLFSLSDEDPDKREFIELFNEKRLSARTEHPGDIPQPSTFTEQRALNSFNLLLTRGGDKRKLALHYIFTQKFDPFLLDDESELKAKFYKLFDEEIAVGYTLDKLKILASTNDLFSLADNDPIKRAFIAVFNQKRESAKLFKEEDLGEMDPELEKTLLYVFDDMLAKEDDRRSEALYYVLSHPVDPFLLSDKSPLKIKFYALFDKLSEKSAIPDLNAIVAIDHYDTPAHVLRIVGTLWDYHEKTGALLADEEGMLIGIADETDVEDELMSLESEGEVLTDGALSLYDAIELPLEDKLKIAGQLLGGCVNLERSGINHYTFDQWAIRLRNDEEEGWKAHIIDFMRAKIGPDTPAERSDKAIELDEKIFMEESLEATSGFVSKHFEEFIFPNKWTVQESSPSEEFKLEHQIDLFAMGKLLYEVFVPEEEMIEEETKLQVSRSHSPFVYQKSRFGELEYVEAVDFDLVKRDLKERSVPDGMISIILQLLKTGMGDVEGNGYSFEKAYSAFIGDRGLKDYLPVSKVQLKAKQLPSKDFLDDLKAKEAELLKKLEVQAPEPTARPPQLIDEQSAARYADLRFEILQKNRALRAIKDNPQASDAVKQEIAVLQKQMVELSRQLNKESIRLADEIFEKRKMGT